jgi:flagellin
MALTVATNNGALFAQTAASNVNSSMETAMARLSTGKRINSASDDAAGVAIASRLTSEVRGLNMAIRNAGDAIAMIQTGEGALDEVTNILQRMRELGVQASTQTNSTTDLANLDKEFQDLLLEITRIEDSTTWAGTKLLDGTGGTSSNGAFIYMVGSGRSGTATTDQITVTFADITTMVAAVTTAADITTQAKGVAAVAAADTAIGLINTERAQLGAKVNRLESTIKNLSNVVNNLQAGRGRIEDADFASETTELARTQILQQASTAMLAQANASKQNVLSLLQG